MKKLFMTFAFACVLSSSVRAGDIPSVNTPVAPPQGQSTNNASVAGDIPTLGFADSLSTDLRSAVLAAFGVLVV